MKTIITGLVAAALCLGTATAASAAINAQQVNQQRLIDAGYRSGKLTYAERARLRTQQRAITTQEATMRARHNGRLTERDKRTLHRLQRQAGRDIQREKYDRQRGRNQLDI
jgi:predicted transglutaminase-like cysteine proteinase